jgi:cytochrome c biogenesis factor
VDVSWYSALRRWSVASWWLLTVSVAVRMRWTYLEPAAGGLWRPDAAHFANTLAWLLSFLLVRAFAVRSGTPRPRSVATVTFAAFGFALIGAALVPRAPGPPDESFGVAAGSMIALAGFALVSAGTVYVGVMRLPAAPPSLQGSSARGSLASLAVYAGLLILLAGLVGRQWWTAHAVRVRPGGATVLTDPFGDRWRFVSQGMSRDERMNYLSTGVALEAWRDARTAGIISAERRQYIDSMQRPTFEPASKPGIRSTAALDVYVVLAEVRGETAQLRVGFRPLVAWVWIGWILVGAGGLALGVAAARRIAGPA